MGNLAYRAEEKYDEKYTQHDMLDVKINTNSDEKVIRGIQLEERNNKNKIKKTYNKILIYAAIFILASVPYINLKVCEIKSSIRISKMKTEKKELIQKTNLLKLNYDKNINLNKIEEQAKQQFNMSIIEQINYISVK